MINNIEQNTGGKRGAHRDAATKNDETDFKAIVDLLAEHSQAENELEQLQADANQMFLDSIAVMKPKYARLQQRLVEAGAQLEVLARKHPDWFAEKKTIKTPYGSVQLKNNPPKIVADNPELSIVLIERDDELIPKTIDNAPNPDAVDADKLLHLEKTLNLEALAGCPDAQLKKWRLRREQTDTFTVKSAKLDMGKAVKESTAAEGKQEKK